MNVLISLLIDDNPRPFPSDRPFCLTPLAGDTLLGHVLRFLLQDLPQFDLTLLVWPADQAAVTAWLADRLPDTAVRLLPAGPGLSTAAVLQAHPALLDDAPLLLVDGLPIVQAPFDTLAETAADVVVLADGTQPTGMVWLRHGRDLTVAFAAGAADLTGVVADLAAAGRGLATLPVVLALHINDEATLFQTNRDLLGLGYGSQDAIERSYAEDFTVIPPVFVDATAVIDNCVLGPYASIGAGAVLTDSFVRNSIVDAGSELTLVFLDGALIGQDVVVHGRAKALRARDGAQIDLAEQDHEQ